ncbi:hypothetical protein GLOIN_2v1778880 [Rhizophagus clarus]|uniref:Uncharacterized protein n=1 Tax=Rhizophagus clarus TaxID=94130 RepID=A0A8H3LJH8_9GLOM|nr:hypothetical protein GLOIN_2v1778880 [Rhizophagus clarus]
MSAIATKFVTDYQLNEMSIKELSQTGRTKSQVTPKEGGAEAEVNICCAKSACQVSDIIPEGEIIRETAQRIMRDSLGEKEVKLIAKALTETSPNLAIIEATKILGMTTLSNKIQKTKSLLCEDEGIHYWDHFLLESVKERLDSFAYIQWRCNRICKNRDQQDIPRVFRSLEKNEERAKQLLTWIQEAISSRWLGNLGTPETGILSRFLKKTEFLPKTGKLLLPSSLRNLGAVFAVVASGVRNLSKANTIASQALRHSPKNNTVSSQRYTIVNYRPRGMPYNQANPFMFFDEN